MSKICGVYKITNTINGKLYVGSSKDITSRWDQHKRKLNNETHGNPHLQNAWLMYGGENFKFEIIEECSSDIQFEREQYYLDLLNPFDGNGYNIVRRISEKYTSDNYIEKVCERCHKPYATFSNRAKYCDQCREEIKNNFLETKRSSVQISAKHEEEVFNAYMSRCVPGYGSAYYWNTEI